MADSIKKIQFIVETAIKEVEKKDNLKEAADVAIERMKKRTRLGKGVLKPEGQATSLKPLEPSTVNIRKTLKKAGRLTGPGATPSKSGVNRTGATLESLHSVAKDGAVAIELDADGTKVAEDLIKIDKQRFTFMNLSKAEVKAMTDVLEEKVQKLDSKLR